MEQLATSFLLFLSSLLGVTDAPVSNDQWQIVRTWEEHNGYRRFEAKSEKIVERCQKNPDSAIKFPLIIHGSHQVLSNQTVLLEFGSSDFSKAGSFYYSPVLPCEKVASAKTITWVAYGYTPYFARFRTFPAVIKDHQKYLFKSITLTAMAIGALLMLAMFSAIVFFNKVSRSLAFNVIGSCLGFAIYFIFTISEYFNWNIDMLLAHKLADTGVWMGCFWYAKGLFERGVIGKISHHIFVGSVFFALTFIVFGQTGDVVQVGTTLPFPLAITVLILSMFSQFKQLRTEVTTGKLLDFVSVLSFTVAAHYDIFVITGFIEGTPIMSLGILFAIFGYTLAVNDEITQTYLERDSLLHSLEEKVEEKTQGLVYALKEKEKAQAELVQSAKLASLGTLSAGIAHEINNSINYVNGAIKPLEKILSQVEIDDKKKRLVNNLLNSINEGSQMTVDIVRSLRNFTGLNQSKFIDINLKESSLAVLTILKNKLSQNYEVNNEIPEDIHIFGDKVGINQVFMNLISNAVDAMPEGGQITLKAFDNTESITLCVSDNGEGMPENIKNQVFDPFFTTKSVGKGTGLGLHIVKKEIDKHGGSIEVQSTPGQGTEFVIKFPKSVSEAEIREAA